MRRLLPILMLLPLAAFAALVYWVGMLFDEGQTRNGILLMLAGLAGLAALEFPLLRYWLLPRWGQAIVERVYAGDYVPANDGLVTLAEEIRRTGDKELLPRLEALVRADASRLRGWRELADIQLHVFSCAEEAIATLKQGAMAVHDKEDKALLLYRAAQWTEKHRHAAAGARELFAETARKFPKTVYGRKAAEKAGA